MGIGLGQEKMSGADSASPQMLPHRKLHSLISSCLLSPQCLPDIQATLGRNQCTISKKQTRQSQCHVKGDNKQQHLQFRGALKCRFPGTSGKDFPNQVEPVPTRTQVTSLQEEGCLNVKLQRGSWLQVFCPASIPPAPAGAPIGTKGNRMSFN